MCLLVSTIDKPLFVPKGETPEGTVWSTQPPLQTRIHCVFTGTHGSQCGPETLPKNRQGAQGVNELKLSVLGARMNLTFVAKCFKDLSRGPLSQRRASSQARWRGWPAEQLDNDRGKMIPGKLPKYKETL